MPYKEYVMSLSQMLDRVVVYLRSISGNVILLVSIAIFFYTFYPLVSRLFRPSDDYAIYEYFAEAVSKGINPYSVPDDYRSDIVPTIIEVGHTQPSVGIIRKEYADYPPLLMIINSFVFRLHNLKGLFGFYILLYALSIVLLIIYTNLRKFKNHSPEVNPLILLLFFGLNPIFTQGWFQPITDKVWFPFFILLMLISRDKPYLITVILGFFAAVKGIGILIIVFYILYQYCNKSLSPKKIFYLVLMFGSILVLSHLIWFPDWIKGYQWRLGRQNYVNHVSMFLPFNKMGYYWSGIPLILTLSAFLLLAWLIIKRIVMLDEVLMLAIVFSIIFNTELGYDRAFVAVFALSLVARYNMIILISYFVGILLVTYAGEYSWYILWGWIDCMIWALGHQILARKSTTVALQTNTGNL
jgi:hypothetical protein